ncbi:hypothetical protein ACJX0J_024712, partial [Zea mays]
KSKLDRWGYLRPVQEIQGRRKEKKGLFLSNLDKRNFLWGVWIPNGPKCEWRSK